MLQRVKSTPPVEGTFGGVTFLSPGDILIGIRQFVLRQYGVIVLVTLLMAALGAVYILTTPPVFTATARLIIDSRRVQVFQQQQIVGDMALNASAVESEAEILRSDSLALSVIRELRLTELPEFNTGGGLIGSIMDVASGFLGLKDETPSVEQIERSAVAAFGKRLNVKRVGLTYVIEISYDSFDAERAAQIANALADAYIVDQLRSRFQATRRAGVWLQDRIQELRGQASSSEQAVLDYKVKNNIVDTGGRLVTEQQLAEINSQLIAARAQTAESKARLDRIEEIVRSGTRIDVPDGTVTDTLRNEVITRLRQQYLDLSNREAEWSKRYGRNHLATVSLRNQMQEIRNSILDELRRIAETFKSDYEIAKTRQDSIQKSLDNVIAESQSTGQAQIALKDFESSAQTYRALHDNFLQKYMESIQQQSFPISDARLISPATPPLRKSSPKTLLILVISLAGGGMAGVAVGWLRDVSDRVFRTNEQVESALQLRCLAIIPEIERSSVKAITQGAETMRQPGARTLQRNESLQWQVVDAPLSRFSESIRAVRVSVSISEPTKGAKVIAVTSSLAGEGKSTIAANLAMLMACEGSRVLLVDGDSRNPTLSRSLAQDAKTGLRDVLLGKAPLDPAILTDNGTGLSFLPSAAPRDHQPFDMLALESATRLFDQLRERFQYIIVDMPPLTAVVDVRSTANFVDSYIYVVAWGKSKIDTVVRALHDADGVNDKTLGVVLNKADMSVIGRYDNYRGNYYYDRYGGRYGYKA